MPTGAPVKVVVRNGPQYSLDPTSHEYERLSQWVANNRSGWHRYIADNGRIGVEVECEAWSLNFSGSGVLARIGHDTFIKGVEPSDYAYLRERHGGT